MQSTNYFAKLNVMIEEEGIVMEVSGDIAFIKSKKSAACEDCGSKSLCKGMGDDTVIVEADNRAHAEVGDLVIFAVEENAMLKAGFAFYFFPLMAFVIFSSLGYYYGDLLINGANKDFMALAFGFTGIFLAYRIVKLFISNETSKPTYTPTIIRVLASGN